MFVADRLKVALKHRVGVVMRRGIDFAAKQNGNSTSGSNAPDTLGPSRSSSLHPIVVFAARETRR